MLRPILFDLRSRALLRLLVLALLLGAGLLRSAAAEEGAVATESPDVVVETVSSDILDIIRTFQGTFDTNSAAYFAAVDERMDGFIDYPAIARAVMAKYWAEATAAQQERFVATFRQGLVRTYGRALLEFEQERITVLPLREEHLRGNRALVRMEISASNGRVYPLQYSMALDGDGAWRVRNVIVDGVNLGLTYRNQFASAMQSGEARGDIDAVIDSWTLVPAADADS